jgi:hypothetical protein
MNVPETLYAKTVDGVHIAYQVIGDGPGDLVFVPGFVYNIEQAWEWPHMARFARRLSSFAGLSSSIAAGRDFRTTSFPVKRNSPFRPGWTTSEP